jgi:hypothetical protein
MSRTSTAMLIILACLGTSSVAQVVYVGPGSTPQGDYLRGVGVAAYGIGMGNLHDAQAGAINLDTNIRFNEYVAAVLKNENEENAAHRDGILRKKREEYNQNRERIFRSPEAKDVDKGDALNAVLEKMNAGLIQESTHRSADVPLSVDEVRRIPFKLAEKGVRSFSMYRLTVKERGKWPIAFQDRQFDRERRIYELALDHALEQHVQGAAQLEAIDGLKSAVTLLSDRLDQVMAGNPADRRFIEAKASLRELDAIVEMLKTHKIQPALVDLDQYHGTTVNDLRVFMRNHGLQFADAQSKEERELFPRLYEMLKMHYEKVNAPVGDRGRN